MGKTVSYKDFISEELQDPELAAEYLNTARAEDDPRLFLVALKHIVDAQGGMSQLADLADMSRSSLYRTLSPEGNPRLSSLEAVLAICGLELSFVPQRRC